MPPQDDSLLRDVEDAIRHDRMMALWRTYRGPLFAAAAALVVATAGSALWKTYEKNRAGEAMQQFTIAQQRYEAGDFKAAADDFATTAEIGMGGALRDLAHLWQGRALIADGRTQEAVTVLEQVATAPEGDDAIWSDLACLHLVGIAPTKTDCLKAGDSPLAGERALVRAASLWQQGKMEEAAALLDSIAANASYSESLRSRARDYRSVTATPPSKG